MKKYLTSLSLLGNLVSSGRSKHPTIPVVQPGNWLVTNRQAVLPSSGQLFLLAIFSLT